MTGTEPLASAEPTPEATAADGASSEDRGHICRIVTLTVQHGYDIFEGTEQMQLVLARAISGLRIE